MSSRLLKSGFFFSMVATNEMFSAFSVATIVKFLVVGVTVKLSVFKVAVTMKFSVFRVVATIKFSIFQVNPPFIFSVLMFAVRKRSAASKTSNSVTYYMIQLKTISCPAHLWTCPRAWPIRLTALAMVAFMAWRLASTGTLDLASTGILGEAW